MNDEFKVYVDQLRDGHEEEIDEVFPPDFIGVNEKDLIFNDPVKVQGTAYLADDSLILHFDIETQAKIACAICNAPVEVEVIINNFYHAVPLSETSGIFDMQDILRETIILETPQFAECNEGQCSEREKLSKYLKKSSSNDDGIEPSDDDGYRPFSNLELR